VIVDRIWNQNATMWDERAVSDFFRRGRDCVSCFASLHLPLRLNVQCINSGKPHGRKNEVT